MTYRGGGNQPGAAEPSVGVRGRRRFPTFGLDSLALILLASYSVHAHWIGAEAVGSVRTVVEASHLIAGFICVLIVGSILSLDPGALAKTLPRLLLVVLVASVAALAAGTVAGRMAGFAGSEALFLVVIPVLSGGLSAGALPLALGYGNTFGDGGAILAALLPAVFLGNLVAVVVAGALGHLRHRRRTGIEGGRLVTKAEDEARQPVSIASVAAAISLLLAAAVAAYWIRRLTGISEPVSLLALSGILLASNAVPRPLHSAIVAVYRFSAKVLIVPVLVIVGSLYLPWHVLLEGFSLKNLFVIVATVGGLLTGGYLLSLLVRFDPIDGSIVAVSRAAMGGTGDIAMLSAARRLDLMPFAQIVTRLGGAITVFFALLAL